MSWAAVAKSVTAPAAPTEVPAPTADERIAVIDTNAIISGLRLEQLADRFCTIPEVLAEVRDKQSRAFLSTLPFSLDVREPTDESVRAVQRFARETGDIHSLSAVDLKLLALAHSLEVVAHGAANLRDHPVQVRTRPKHKTRPRALPGWGNVSNPEEWKVVDEAPEELMSNAPGGQAQSRIIAGVQSLSLSAGDTREPGGPTDPGAPHPQAAGGTAPAAVLRPGDPLPALPLPLPPATFGAAAAAASGGEAPSQPERAASAGAAGNGPVGPGAPAGPGLGDGDGEDDDEEEEEDGAWETAHKSRNAARRKQRRARRHQAWLEAQQQQQQQGPGAAAAPSVSGRGREEGSKAPAAQQPQQPPHPGSGGEQPAAATAAEAAAAADGGADVARSRGADAEEEEEEEEGQREGGAGSAEDDGDGSEEGEEGEEMEEVEGEELVTDEEYDGDGASEADTTTATDGSATAITGLADTEADTEGGVSELLPNTTSNVFTVTADFAMQNVMLQMGLRLVTRDGKQITRVSRWALRCSACFFVTKEAGRLFCPRCGNMTMDKVEVTVGPGGAEFFGVRKKYILRGTRFSLPKPKGGRSARFNPVLREDVLLARTGGLKPKRNAAKKKPAAATGELDPFAPEFDSETWHQAAAAAGGRAGGRGGAPGVLLTSWRNNPNEAKSQRKSRRK